MLKLPPFIPYLTLSLSLVKKSVGQAFKLKKKEKWVNHLSNWSRVRPLLHGLPDGLHIHCNTIPYWAPEKFDNQRRRSKEEEEEAALKKKKPHWRSKEEEQAVKRKKRKYSRGRWRKQNEEDVMKKGVGEEREQKEKWRRCMEGKRRRIGDKY